MANEDFKLDLDDSQDLVEVPKTLKKPKAKETVKNDTPKVNCLRNERIIVRFVPKSGRISNPKHVLYGGMAENSVRMIGVPRLSSGLYVNVLTDSEKDFLEEVMGLEKNALSIYKKEDNFWDDSNPNGVNRVRLHKQDNYLNLSNPEEYIKYKILLANKNIIAPSLKYMQDHPKATYQFVIIQDGEEVKEVKKAMSTTMECYKEYGKIEEDKDTLRTLVETLDGRPTALNVKLEFLQARINELIQKDSKTFLRVITDPMLKTKVLIKRSIEEGTISRRGDYLYLRADNTPLCERNEEPTLSVAAKFLNNPKHQDILFTLQAKLN